MALSLSRSQASRIAGVLVRRGLAQEVQHRAAGFSRSITAYALTPQGEEEAGRLRASVAPRPVEQDQGGRHATSTRPVVFDSPAQKSPERGTFRRDLLDAPPARLFFGRARVLEDVEAWLRGRGPVLATEGVAGQGKSALAAHVLRAMPPPRHVLWIRVSDSLTTQAFLERLDWFLRSLGRPGALPPEEDLAGLLGHFRSRMGRLPLLVVADDLQKAGEALRPSFWAFVRACAVAGNAKVWLLGREVVLPHDVVPETRRSPLPPLPDEEAVQLLDGYRVAAAARLALVRRCGGSPLYLLLAARSPLPARRGTDFANYLLDELVPTFSEAQRSLLRWFAALRVAASPAFLQRLGSVHPDALARLEQGNLVFRDASQQFDMHDLVRETLYEALPPDERRRIHDLLAEAYRPRADDWSGAMEFLHHMARADRREDAIRWLLRNRSRFLQETESLLGGRPRDGDGLLQPAA